MTGRAGRRRVRTRALPAGAVVRGSRRLRLGSRRRRNRAADAIANRTRTAFLAPAIADLGLVAVVAVARLVAALEALADELLAAFLVVAALLDALAVVADDLGVAFIARALVVVAVLAVADDQLVPLVLVGAFLGVALVAVADDALSLAVLAVAGLLRGAVAAVADNLLLVPVGLGAELRGDGLDLGGLVGPGAVRLLWRAGCDGAGGGPCDGAGEGVVRTGGCGFAIAIGMLVVVMLVLVLVVVLMFTLVLIVVIVVMLILMVVMIMVVANSDVEAQGNVLLADQAAASLIVVTRASNIAKLLVNLARSLKVKLVTTVAVTSSRPWSVQSQLGVVLI